MLEFKGIDVEKTSELVGVALDWTVAKCEGRQWPDPAAKYIGEQYYKPSSDWALGGPIIEREAISIITGYIGGVQTGWVAEIGYGSAFVQQPGPTPLIAAMRCYCCAKLGEFVDVPEEILGLEAQASSFS